MGIDWDEPIEYRSSNVWCPAVVVAVIDNPVTPYVVAWIAPGTKVQQVAVVKKDSIWVRNVPQATRTVWINCWQSGPGGYYYSTEVQARTAAGNRISAGVDTIKSYYGPRTVEIPDV